MRQRTKRSEGPVGETEAASLKMTTGRQLQEVMELLQSRQLAARGFGVEAAGSSRAARSSRRGRQGEEAPG